MEYRITHFNSFSDYSVMESRLYSEKDEDIISKELIESLFYYRQVLGVTCVRLVKGIISWDLNGCWYSSNEIERMLKLKTFA